jgi:tRNA 2-thiouridine synthesizing protein A
MSHHELDARYLLCPMPVIRAQERIAQLARADTLIVRCTDPGALHDIPAWCRIHGHTVVETRTGDGEVFITVRVGDTGTSS